MKFHKGSVDALICLENEKLGIQQYIFCFCCCCYLTLFIATFLKTKDNIWLYSNCINLNE